MGEQFQQYLNFIKQFSIDYLEFDQQGLFILLGLTFLLLILVIVRRKRVLKKVVKTEKIVEEKASDSEYDKEYKEDIDVLEQKAPKKDLEIKRRTSLKDGVSKTREGFIGRIINLVGSKDLDDSVLEELEDVLFTADIGVRTADWLLEDLRESLKKGIIKDRSSLIERLKGKILDVLTFSDDSDNFVNKPHVCMVVGVNGVGKTTTIGKLSSMYHSEGKKVVLAAADTFRAAAVEQLEIWANRADVKIVKGKDGADPGSVVFNAIKAAEAKEASIVLADTAGRLHTKVNLMEELKKVHRVIGKAMTGAPHEIILVIDATTGQNAINQVKLFNEALGLTGIILTKLDGTAKGGVIIGVCQQFNIPVKYIGIGEQVDDLRKFKPKEFVDALFDVL